MGCFGVLYRRRLAAYAVSPLFYVGAAIFLAASGLDLWHRFASAPFAAGSWAEVLFGGERFWLAAGAFCAALTMSLFAENKINGCLESLLATPATEAELVLAEYFAALTVFLAAMALCGLRLAAAEMLDVSFGDADPAGILLGAGFVALASGFLTALGVFISALCRRSAAAGAISFMAIILFVFAGRLPPAAAEAFPASGPTFRLPMQYLGDFGGGVFDLRPAVMLATGAALFLFMAVRILESRQWKE